MSSLISKRSLRAVAEDRRIDLVTHPIASVRLTPECRVQAVAFHPYLSSANGEKRRNAKLFPDDETRVISLTRTARP